MARWTFAALYAASLVVPAIIWNNNHTALTGLDSAGLKQAWCRLAGLWAVIVVLWQLLFVSRARKMEQTFGFDRLTRFHHYNGFFAVLLLLLHGSLAIMGHAAKADLTNMEQITDFWKIWKYMQAAMSGQALFLMVTLFSIGIVRRRISYETWHWNHLAGYLALALAFGHQIFHGRDLVDNAGQRYAWIAIQLAAVAILIWGRAVLPVLRSFRHRFRVEKLVKESDDITSVYIAAEGLGSLAPRGGQFVMVRFLAAGFWSQSHPFPLSMPPRNNTLRLTIKSLGDFTARIPNLVPGTRVMIDGPHGIFTARRATGQKVLLIAGGIGITPLRAIVEDLLADKRQVTLLYSARNEKGLALRQELESLTANPDFRLVLILSHDETWAGEKGKLDEEKIARLVSNVAEHEVFLCGPPPMMAATRKTLEKLGVHPGKIFTEEFAL